MSRKIRILMAKPGLDGHDRGAKVVARTFLDAGMEVIYTGLHQSARQIVNAAIQEDVDVIALSILSGTHMSFCKKIIQGLREVDSGDKVLIVGGTIVEEDIPRLKETGVSEVFPPGSPIDAGMTYIRKLFSDRV